MSKSFQKVVTVAEKLENTEQPVIVNSGNQSPQARVSLACTWMKDLVTAKKMVGPRQSKRALTVSSGMSQRTSGGNGPQPMSAFENSHDWRSGSWIRRQPFKLDGERARLHP